VQVRTKHVKNTCVDLWGSVDNSKSVWDVTKNKINVEEMRILGWMFDKTRMNNTSNDIMSESDRKYTWMF